MLEKSIHHLTETIADLKGRTEKLEHRVNPDSQNSSQPPSADGPFAKPERKKKKQNPKKERWPKGAHRAPAANAPTHQNCSCATSGMHLRV
jgi:hypothetical protein